MNEKTLISEMNISVEHKFCFEETGEKQAGDKIAMHWHSFRLRFKTSLKRKKDLPKKYRYKDQKRDNLTANLNQPYILNSIKEIGPTIITYTGSYMGHNIPACAIYTWAASIWICTQEKFSIYYFKGHVRKGGTL